MTRMGLVNQLYVRELFVYRLDQELSALGTDLRIKYLNRRKLKFKVRTNGGNTISFPELSHLCWNI